MKHNYLPDFNRRELRILTLEHTKGQPGLGFNSLEGAKGAQSLKDKPQLGRQTNIFAYLGQQTKEPKQFSAALNINNINHTQTLNVDRRINKAASLQVDHGKEERKLEPSARSDPAQSMKINPGSIKKVKDAQLNL